MSEQKLNSRPAPKSPPLGSGIDPVFQIRKNLGERITLLRCDGKRPRDKGWPDLKPGDMTPSYLASLKGGNIGVSLGAASGGLCVIDIDDDALVEPFLALNPALSNTFRTHGSRGCALWIQVKGKYPRTFRLKTESGDDAGEFRSTGGQSIVWGTHPETKQPYKLLVKQPAVEIDFDSIQWPEGTKLPPCTEEPEAPEGPEVTEESRGDAGRSDSSAASSPSLSSDSSGSSASSIHGGRATLIRDAEDVLRRCVPTKSHANNGLLFKLARGVKALELVQETPYSPEQLHDLFELWYGRSVRFLRPDQSKEEYRLEFLSACMSAKHPLGGMAVINAFENAKRNPLPREAEQFENEDLRLVVALCFELQRVNGNKPFYLSSYNCADLLGHKSHTLVAKWLKSLRALKIIELAEQGNTHRASRYRYLNSCAAPAEEEQPE